MPVIKIKNREISYDFEFKQKFLFIRGDSGIGKTSLIQLVADYNLNPDAVSCDGDTNIRVLISKNDLVERGLIFFLDENSPLLVESQSASFFNASDNYFVIITRSRKFNGFKTGLDSIVTMFPGSDGTHTISKDRFGIALRKLKSRYKESEFTIVYDSHDFLLYKLPISIIEANDVVIDDAFKRINSTGRKLSPQDLRQAGVVSKFSDLVRTIATHLRGDATEDVIEMNEIADYSLNSFGLDYGLPIKDIFWVEQGILSEDALKRSKDEEIIAILCNCILNGDDCGMSVNTINHLYNTQSKNYNKDIVFIVIFLTFARLYSENYYIVDYQGMNTILNGIADKELNDIIAKSECQWNAKVRTHLIERVKNVLVPYMEFQEQDPKWNQIFRQREGCT